MTVTQDNDRVKSVTEKYAEWKKEMFPTEESQTRYAIGLLYRDGMGEQVLAGLETEDAAIKEEKGVQVSNNSSSNRTELQTEKKIDLDKVAEVLS